MQDAKFWQRFGGHFNDSRRIVWLPEEQFFVNGFEEILNRMGHPHLDLAKVYAALTYYHANREEIETDLAQEEADVKQFEQEWLQSKLNK